MKIINFWKIVFCFQSSATTLPLEKQEQRRWGAISIPMKDKNNNRKCRVRFAQSTWST